MRSKTVLSTILLLDDLGKSNTISLNWIKAPNGHAMNDIADNLAKTGAESFGPLMCTPIPDAHIKELIDSETMYQEKMESRLGEPRGA